MAFVQVVQGILLVTGCLFFAIGTLGLFRFSDTLLRIHALTKVDNLGLGFIILALVLNAASLAIGVKVLLIWVVALAASATSAHLIARAARLQQGDDSEPKGSHD
ncbi:MULTISPECIES: monovalent cation/H(+) antiporter subunit G [unclassified Marinobacter]|uniref:cation:proton antiporter n=1 Tax=unclassified Marinobacter TaxID=83889 RepID=UPI0026E26742|nr:MULTISPECIES: monovalent cation/H(+) antiporter subunit G [unclassified Marinobacter]MDO6443022.1 monovalent cation/H(+) antiporter subunit G [Marinobacter sp. 2_MG-2023]MDO6822777.1 monovalent cation/H(+) antiporter subunit G [Marinobacter sp. 1_MG-2023]